MQIFFNGETKEIPENQSLLQLLEFFHLKAERLAIELNQAVIPRTKWPDTYLKPGDRVEVVHFVGGGDA